MEGMQQDVTLDRALVAAKAYEIWQSNGCPDGRAAAERNWFEAERQLKSRLAEARTESVAVHSVMSSEPPPVSETVAAHHVEDTAEATVPSTPKTKKIAASPRRGSRR